MREWPCVMNMMRNAIKVDLSNVVPRENEFVDAFEVAKFMMY